MPADCVNLPKHQFHILATDFIDGFKCEDVIKMEKDSGRHVYNCTWVGYFTAAKCGCTK